MESKHFDHVGIVEMERVLFFGEDFMIERIYD